MSLSALVVGLGLVLFVLFASTAASRADARGCGQSANSNPESVSNGQARDAVLCLINKERAKAGLGSLDQNKKLQKAAQRHTEKMVGSGCFDHQCSGEGDLGTRLESVDYLSGGLTSWAYGENIAYGVGDHGSPQALVDAWMNSPPHRANILSSGFDDIGIGFSAGTPNGRHAAGGSSTLDFGHRAG
jgi:uncharacterized protein YkwD